MDDKQTTKIVKAIEDLRIELTNALFLIGDKLDNISYQIKESKKK